MYLSVDGGEEKPLHRAVGPWKHAKTLRTTVSHNKTANRLDQLHTAAHLESITSLTMRGEV